MYVHPTLLLPKAYMSKVPAHIWLNFTYKSTFN